MCRGDPGPAVGLRRVRALGIAEERFPLRLPVNTLGDDRPPHLGLQLVHDDALCDLVDLAGVRSAISGISRRAGRRGARGESRAEALPARCSVILATLLSTRRFTTVAQLMIMKHAGPLVGGPLRADHLTPSDYEQDGVSVNEYRRRYFDQAVFQLEQEHR